jgi:hypothetical protein
MKRAIEMEMLRLSSLSNEKRVEAALSGRAKANICPQVPFASPIVAVCVDLPIQVWNGSQVRPVRESQQSTSIVLIAFVSSPLQHSFPQTYGSRILSARA